MSYTVVGLFPNNETADDASRRLNEAGFPETDYSVSKYRTEGDYDSDDYDYDEDNDTRGFWDRLFGDNDSDRKAYSYAGSKNNVVTVYTDDKDRAEKAREIMDDAGATSVDDHLSDSFHNTNPDYRVNRNFSADTTEDRTDYRTEDRNDGDKIDVIKEDINVGKREVEDGALRVRSRIVEKPVEENVRLKQERVYIKRNPVDRAINTDDAFRDSTIEMTQNREVPVVDKTARVVEEISLGKDVDTRDEKITDTVRETKVDIEDNRGNRLNEDEEDRI